MRNCFGLFEQESKEKDAGRQDRQDERPLSSRLCLSPLCPLKLCHNKPSACFVFVAAATASPALAVVVVASSPVAVAFAASSFTVVVAASSAVAVVVVV